MYGHARIANPQLETAGLQILRNKCLVFWRICNPPKSTIRICNPLKPRCHEVNVWACADCKSAIRNCRIANPAEQMIPLINLVFHPTELRMNPKRRSFTFQKTVFYTPKGHLLHAKRPSFRNQKAACFQLPDCQAFGNRPYRPPLQLAILHAKRRRKRTMQMQEMLPGCASEMKIKPRFTRFFFAFRSACTIFAGKNNRNA